MASKLQKPITAIVRTLKDGEVLEVDGFRIRISRKRRHESQYRVRIEIPKRTGLTSCEPVRHNPAD